MDDNKVIDNLAIQCDSLEYQIEQLEQENEHLTEQLGLLVIERDQLKARVAELEEFCDLIASEELPWSIGDLQDLLTSTPAQSLAALEARAIRRLVTGNPDEIATEYDHEDGYYLSFSDINLEADRIEKEESDEYKY